YPEAIKILERGLELSNDPGFKKALAQMYVTWFAARNADAKSSLVERLVYLERALAWDNENLPALQYLLAISYGKGVDADKGRAALEAVLTRGQSSAVVHLAL